jgi:hypothetical protein
VLALLLALPLALVLALVLALLLALPLALILALLPALILALVLEESEYSFLQDTSGEGISLLCFLISLYVLCPHITMHTEIRAHAGPWVGGVPEKEKREKKRIPQVFAYG